MTAARKAGSDRGDDERCFLLIKFSVFFQDCMLLIGHGQLRRSASDNPAPCMPCLPFVAFARVTVVEFAIMLGSFQACVMSVSIDNLAPVPIDLANLSFFEVCFSAAFMVTVFIPVLKNWN